jgi:hypothetical protein
MITLTGYAFGYSLPVFILKIGLSKIGMRLLLSVWPKVFLSICKEQKSAIRNKSNGTLPKLTACMKDIRRLNKAIVLM